MNEAIIKPCYIITFFFTSAVNAGLFFPEDLPTALNVAYSRIPSVRSGVDSRLGFGFRIGPNADFQVQWELGPQRNTIPLPPFNSDGKIAKKSVNKNENEDDEYENENKENEQENGNENLSDKEDTTTSPINSEDESNDEERTAEEYDVQQKEEEEVKEEDEEEEEKEEDKEEEDNKESMKNDNEDEEVEVDENDNVGKETRGRPQTKSNNIPDFNTNIKLLKSSKRPTTTTPDPDYGVKRLRKTLISLFTDP